MNKGIFYKTAFNEWSGDFDSLTASDIEGSSLTLDSIAIDTIIGKTSAISLSFLGSTLTSTIANYLTSINQNLGTSNSPTFTSIYIYDVSANNTFQIKSVVDLAANRICYLPLLTSDDTLLLENHTQSMTNKTINRASNTLTNLNIANADVSATANIDVSKIGNGIVDNTEFNYISNLDQSLSTTSNVVFNNITANVSLNTDTINEITLNAGTTIEGILLKDSAITGATIDSDLNTITNIVDADIKSTANITWTKLQYHQLTGSNWGIGNGALDSTIGGALNNLAIGTLALTALTTADQCIAIGENCGQSITTNGGNLLFGYQCMKGLGGNVLSINNTCMGNNIMITSNTSNCNSNFLLGGGIFLNSTGANSNNILVGVENMRNITSSSNNNNTSLGFRNCFNLTTGSLNNSILIGDSISANAATDILNNIIVIGRSLTLRASPLTNYLQLGTTTQTQFYCPITSLNTDGVLKTASNIISSALLVNADVSATANIDVSKIGTGIVDNTEFNYLNGQNQSLSTTSNVNFGNIVSSGSIQATTIATGIITNGITSATDTDLTITANGTGKIKLFDSIINPSFGAGIMQTDSSGNFSSSYTIPTESTFSGGVKFATTGGTATNLNFYEEYQSTSTWQSGVWSTNGATPGTKAGSFYIVRIGSMITIKFVDVNFALGAIPYTDYINLTTAIPARFRPITNTVNLVSRGINAGVNIQILFLLDTVGGIQVEAGLTGQQFSIAGGNDGFFSCGLSYHIL